VQTRGSSPTGFALELLYLEDIRDWTWDPRLDDSFPFYDPREYVASRLGDLIHGSFAPEASEQSRWPRSCRRSRTICR
jgi:hypothetical protein